MWPGAQSSPLAPTPVLWACGSWAGCGGHSPGCAGLSPASALRGFAAEPASKTEQAIPRSRDPGAFAPTRGGAVSSAVTSEQEARCALAGRQTGGPAPSAQASWDHPSPGSAGAMGKALPGLGRGCLQGVGSGGGGHAAPLPGAAGRQAQVLLASQWRSPDGGGAPWQPAMSPAEDTPPRRATMVPLSSARTDSPGRPLCRPFLSSA